MSNPEEAHLIETAESRQRRSGDHKPLDTSEKLNLTRTASQEAKDKAKRDAINASGIHTKVSS